MKKLLFILIAFVMVSISCNTEVKETNPLLAEWDTPFNVPPFEEVKVEHFVPAFEEAMKQHKAEFYQTLKNQLTRILLKQHIMLVIY